MIMQIVSFGGHVHNEDVPVGRVTNTEASQQASKIVEALAKIPAGDALPIEVTNFGPYERYALQNRLQKRGAKCVVRIKGDRDKDGNIKKGVLYVLKFTDEQWKAYNSQPGAKPAKK